MSTNNKQVTLMCGIFGILLDPDNASKDARVMKTVVRLNKNTAGVYGTAVQTGRIHVGDPVSLVLNVRR